MSLIEQIKNGESKILDFKRELPSNKKIAQTAVAFANTAGGRLIIGVDDNRDIAGIKEDDIFEIMDKVASVIADSCHPDILPEIYTVNIEDKLLLVIEISRGNLIPYYMKSEGKKKGTYIRVGATNRVAGAEYIQELERQKQNISFDEEIVHDVESDIDATPIADRFRKIDKPLDMQKMKALKLIKEINGKDYPSKALYILLGIFEHCSIKCARFRGDDMSKFIDQKEYTGDIITQLENALKFLQNHLHVRGDVKGLQRTDTLEIPLEALREALVNAVVHRDYSNFGRDIKLAVFDSSLKITSPGGLPNTITMQDIEEGRSEVRNRAVARVLKELNIIEQWGSGIKRIKSACAANGLPDPLIEERGDSVVVEFVRISGDRREVPETTGDHRRPPETAGDLLEHEIDILQYVETNGKITTPEAVELLKIKDARVREIFREMSAKELISKKGRGNKTYYVKYA